MGVTGEKFGALRTLCELNGGALWLAEDLLIGLQGLLFDAYCGFCVDELLLLAANFVLKLGAVGSEVLLLSYFGRKHELRLRLQEEHVLERELANFKQLYVVAVCYASEVSRFQTRIRQVL